MGQTSDSIYVCPPEDDWSNVQKYQMVIENFLDSTMIFPPSVIKDSLNGQIIITFTIEENGELKNCKIKKGLREDVDNEVLRVLKLVHFNRAAVYSSNGKPHSINFTLPINIQCGSPKLNNNKNHLP
jgi:TonB family protein